MAEGSLLPLSLHSPHLPIFFTPAFVPSLAPVAQGGEEGGSRWMAFNTRGPPDTEAYWAIPAAGQSMEKQ